MKAMCPPCVLTQRLSEALGEGRWEAAGANVAPKYTQDRRCPDGDLSLTGAFAVLKWFSSKCWTLRRKDLYAFSKAAKLGCTD